jgi:hypothetical protein
MAPPRKCIASEQLFHLSHCGWLQKPNAYAMCFRCGRGRHQAIQPRMRQCTAASRIERACLLRPPVQTNRSASDWAAGHIKHRCPHRRTGPRSYTTFPRPPDPWLGYAKQVRSRRRWGPNSAPAGFFLSQSRPYQHALAYRLTCRHG